MKKIIPLQRNDTISTVELSVEIRTVKPSSDIFIIAMIDAVNAYGYLFFSEPDSKSYTGRRISNSLFVDSRWLNVSETELMAMVGQSPHRFFLLESREDLEEFISMCEF